MADKQTTFGQALTQFRQSANLGRAELARRARMNTSHLFRLETGGRSPSRDAVLLLGEALDLNGESLNGLLAAAGFAPMPVFAKDPVRTRGPGRAAVRQSTLPGRAALLEEMGLTESNIARLVQTIEWLPVSRQLEVTGLIRAVVSRVTAMKDTPISAAVIPLVGRSYNVLAAHVVQRLIIGAIREAAEVKISKVFVALPQSMAGSFFMPLKEALEVAVAPFISLHCSDRPGGESLEDLILEAEEFVGDSPFAVLIPDQVTGGAIKNPATQGLSRMTEVFKQSPGANLVAVSRASRYRRRHRIVQAAGRQEDSPVMSVISFFEQDDLSNPASPTSDLFGVVGRYILQPAVLRELRELKARGGEPASLASALEQLRDKGGDVFAFEWEGKRQDVGEILELANELA